MNTTYCYSTGKEPSPQALGRCAHLEKEGTVAKGADGCHWKVMTGTNCRQYWKKLSDTRSPSRYITYYSGEEEGRCPSGMIENPATGRLVLRSGAIGQQLLGGCTPTRRRKRSSSSTSRKGKVLNPETGNYVLRTGAVGKRVLAERRR